MPYHTISYDSSIISFTSKSISHLAENDCFLCHLRGFGGLSIYFLADYILLGQV